MQIVIGQPALRGPWPPGTPLRRDRPLLWALALALLGICAVAASLLMPGAGADPLPRHTAAEAGHFASGGPGPSSSAPCSCPQGGVAIASDQAWRVADHHQPHPAARHAPRRSAAIALPGPSGEVTAESIRAEQKASQRAADPRRYLAMTAHLARFRTRAAPQSRPSSAVLPGRLSLPYPGHRSDAVPDAGDG